MTEADQETLHEAIARNATAVISLPSAGLLHHHKTRFLAAGEGGFYVESIRPQADLIDQLIVSRKPIGMAFKSATTRIIFATPIWRRHPEFHLNKQVIVEALLLPFPEGVKSVIRRAAYRVYVPSTSDIVVRIWKLTEEAELRDKPLASQELQCRPRDISIGGMGLLCPPKDGQPVALCVEQRLRVLIVHKRHETLLEGCVRHLQTTPDQSLRVGVQFNKLDEGIDGRQAMAKLTTIVGELHREEVRRVRLGLMGA